MTTTKPELCPDCKRPKAKDARAQTEGCKQGLLGPDGEPHRSKCHELTIAHLRRELSSVRALSEAERRVMESAVQYCDPDADDDSIAMYAAVENLLALRKEPDGT